MSLANIKPILDAPKSDNTPVLSEHREYMCEEHVIFFLEMLEEWRMRLISEAGQTVHHMQTDVERYADPVDAANLDDEQARELRRRDRERKLIWKIDQSINRLLEGDYGYCDGCGAEIGLKRLEARPTATACIDCKTVAEIREAQEGDGTRREQ